MDAIIEQVTMAARATAIGQIPSPLGAASDVETIQMVVRGEKPAAFFDMPITVGARRVLREHEIPGLIMQATSDPVTGNVTPMRMLIGHTTAALDRLRHALTATPDHAELGRALGYPESDIAAYVERHGPGGPTPTLSPEDQAQLDAVNLHWGLLATVVAQHDYRRDVFDEVIAAVRKEYHAAPLLLAQVDDFVHRIDAQPETMKPLLDTFIAQAALIQERHERQADAPVTVRVVTPSDRPRIGEMARLFVQDTAYKGRVAEDDTNVDVTLDYVVTNGQGWVAERAGRVVGMIGATVYVHPCLNRKFGSQVVWWVDVDARRSKAGELLFHAAEDWARAQGAVGMQFTAYRHPILERFYRRMGYQSQEVVFEKEFAPCVPSQQA